MANNNFLRYNIFVFIFLFLSIKASSKQIDTLIFNSSFEKSIFLDHINSKWVEPLNFLIAPNYSNNSESINKSLKELYATLEKTGLLNQSKKKQIKTIYKKVYDLYLKKYSEEAVFSDIFKDGSYNCFAASGLFAIIFDHYNIEYAIKKTSVHIYLIADPNGEKIAIETALPTKGLVEFDQYLKKGYVEYLRENKLISDYDYNTNTVDRLFEINYNKATTINLTQLSALQYYNWGVIQFKSFVYDAALLNLEKAEILFNDESIRFLKNTTLINLLSEGATSFKYSGKNLAKFLNQNYKNLESVQFVKEYFNSITNELIFNHPNVDAYKSFYSEYDSNIDVSASNQDIVVNYYNSLGFFYFTKNEYYKSLSFIDQSYRINPDNIFTKQNITGVIEKIISPKDDFFDSETMIDSVEYYLIKYPILKSSSKVLLVTIGLYENTVKTYIELGQLTKVSMLLNRLEQFIKSFDSKENVDNFVCNIYNSIASYFYRIQLFDKADYYLRLGLKSYPNSNLLITTQNNIDELRDKSIYNIRSSLGLDAESYSVVKSLAIRRKATINSNIDRYLINQKWKIGLYTFEDRIKTLPIKEQVTLTFESKRNLEIGTSKGVRSGKWSFNTNDNILKITDRNDSLLLRLMIYDIDSSMIKTVKYSDENNIKILTLLKKM